MDTLILVQDESKLTKMVKETPPQMPAGVGSTMKLEILPRGDPSAAAALGDAGAILGSALMNRIGQKIISFADKLLADEPKRPNPRDIVTFQILFLFHQTSADVASAIARALERLPFEQRWTGLPDKHHRMLRVLRVWMISCESGADATAKDPRLVKYVRQAARLRAAAQTGLKTEVKPPQSQPREFFPPPSVYEFSTGDPVTGGLKLHPNAVEFVKTPNWQIGANGDIEPIPNTNPDQEGQSGGTVYKFDDPASPPSTTDIPAGGKVDVLRQP